MLPIHGTEWLRVYYTKSHAFSLFVDFILKIILKLDNFSKSDALYLK